MRGSFLFGLILFLFSCGSGKNEKKADEAKSKKELKEEATGLLAKIKSYEPGKYKGKVPKDFYSFYGMYDWWRFPLVYPYSINCIDVIENGGVIVSDLEVKDYREGGGRVDLSDYFDKFILDKNHFIGNRINDPFHRSAAPLVEQYFVMSFSSGRIIDVSGKDNLNKKLEEIKFSGDTSFITIRNYYKGLKRDGSL